MHGLKQEVHNVCHAGHLQQLIKECLWPLQAILEQFIEQRPDLILHSIAIVQLMKPSINSARSVLYSGVWPVQEELQADMQV